ncbi:hypothetical protein ACJMK2_000115, partial [Sinanodonta woodiana]
SGTGPSNSESSRGMCYTYETTYSQSGTGPSNSESSRYVVTFMTQLIFRVGQALVTVK